MSGTELSLLDFSTVLLFEKMTEKDRRRDREQDERERERDVRESSEFRMFSYRRPSDPLQTTTTKKKINEHVPGGYSSSKNTRSPMKSPTKKKENREIQNTFKDS